jgi:signal transduction histidine kinase
VIQEALTNVIRHAPTARARVVVRYERDVIGLVISNDAPPAALASTTAARSTGLLADGESSEGCGLVGMRERLALYGGTLHAGPRREGGFEVAARLPALSSEAL